MYSPTCGRIDPCHYWVQVYDNNYQPIQNGCFDVLSFQRDYRTMQVGRWQFVDSTDTGNDYRREDWPMDPSVPAQFVPWDVPGYHLDRTQPMGSAVMHPSDFTPPYEINDNVIELNADEELTFSSNTQPPVQNQNQRPPMGSVSQRASSSVQPDRNPQSVIEEPLRFSLMREAETGGEDVDMQDEQDQNTNRNQQP